MAVYGKFRERWDPTKRKAKVSKNNTLELKIPTATAPADNQRLLFSMRPETLSSTTLGGTRALLSGPTIGDLPLTVRADSLAPELVTIEESRSKPKAIRFPKDGATGNRCYIESAANATLLTADLLAGRSRTYDTFISFWVKVDQLNFGGSSGHNIGGFYRLSSGSQSNNDVSNNVLDALSPAILFNISTTGTVSIRFRQNDTNGSSSSNDSKKIRYESNAAGNKITAGKWCHVTFVIKRIRSTPGGSGDYSSMVDIYIDGVNTGTPTADVYSTSQDYFDANSLELIIGNQEFGYEAGNTQNLADDDTADGFEGAIGEFIIFTQKADSHPSAAGGVENADGKNRREIAKFIYEAQKEGVYALHSGFHSSSPRLEQLDLDQDTAYPPNFTMSTLTKFKETDKDDFYDSARDNRVSLRSESAFKEGYNSGETWEENAGQYHVRSTVNRDLESVTIMPHTRLNPADTLLTNGNWYSDARSEFFSEDLDPKSGFVVSNLNAGIQTTLTAGQDTFVLDSVEGLQVGQQLTKISGAGAFHANGVHIAEINPNGTIKVAKIDIDDDPDTGTTANHATSGDILFNVGGEYVPAQLTGHIPTVSDELYREHASDDTATPFVDDQIPSEYDDCFVIEIPLPVLTDLTLSTDVEDQAGSDKEVAEIKYNSGGAKIVVDSGQKINTMAYYNFKEKKWQHTVPSYSTYSAEAGGISWIGNGDIGFSPLTGLVFPTQHDQLPYFASLYGKPMTNCGFPFHKKFESAEGQTIDISKYIDEPVILKGWEIFCDAVPRVGFTHDPDDGSTNMGTDSVLIPAGNEELFSSAIGSGNFDKSPQDHGANGHACVFWDPDQRIIVDGSNTAGNAVFPFTQLNLHIGPAGQGNYVNNTIPAQSISSGVEQWPTIQDRSIVTKGVTAFLLKETDLFDASAQREKWRKSQPKFVNWVRNTTANNGIIETSYDLSSQVVPTAVTTNLQTATDSAIDGRSSYRIAPLSADFYQPKTTSSGGGRYDRGSSRELIGYLQQVYHSDRDPSWAQVPRRRWNRAYLTDGDIATTDNPSFVLGVKPNYPQGVDLIDSLGKENESYVGNLLRRNTDVYPLHISGSIKIQSQYNASFPITNFKISGDHTSVGLGNKLGTFVYGDSTPNPIMAHSVYPSSEGSTYSSLTQFDAVPSIASEKSTRELRLPIASFPAKPITTSSDAVLAQTTYTKATDVTLSENESAEVVLRPSDKLILGIQDSVSTCFASQQIAENATNYEFIRWGRNYLKLPVSQDGYLRLYVKRTREDNTFNVVSDESRYNHNVSRDLGDHFIDDDHLTHTPLLLTGSISDDIVYPSYGTAPVLKQKVPEPTGEGGTSPFMDNPQILAWLFNAYTKRYAARGTPDSFFGSYDNRSPAQWVASDFNLDWRSLPRKSYYNFDDTVAADRKVTIDWRGNYAADAFMSGLATVVHPQNLRWEFTEEDGSSSTRPYHNWHSTSPYVFGGGGTLMPKEVLSEVQTHNNFRAYQYTNSSGATKTRDFGWSGDAYPTGQKSNACSGWYSRLTLPYIESVSNQQEPKIETLEVDFRTIQIGYPKPATGLTNDQIRYGLGASINNNNDVSSPVGKQLLAVEQPYWNQRPMYDIPAGTQMKLGDAFCFRQTDGKCIRIDDIDFLKANSPGATAASRDDAWWRFNFPASGTGVGKKSKLTLNFEAVDISRQYTQIDFKQGNDYHRLQFSSTITGLPDRVGNTDGGTIVITDGGSFDGADFSGAIITVHLRDGTVLEGTLPAASAMTGLASVQDKMKDALEGDSDYLPSKVLFEKLYPGSGPIDGLIIYDLTDGSTLGKIKITQGGTSVIARFSQSTTGRENPTAFTSGVFQTFKTVGFRSNFNTWVAGATPGAGTISDPYLLKFDFDKDIEYEFYDRSSVESPESSSVSLLEKMVKTRTHENPIPFTEAGPRVTVGWGSQVVILWPQGQRNISGGATNGRMGSNINGNVTLNFVHTSASLSGNCTVTRNIPTTGAGTITVTYRSDTKASELMSAWGSRMMGYGDGGVTCPVGSKNGTIGGALANSAASFTYNPTSGVPVNGSSIVLIDYEGTAKTFEIGTTTISGAITLNNVVLNSGTDADKRASLIADLVAKVNASTLKITAAASATSTTNDTITLTQDGNGFDGNTAIRYKGSTFFGQESAQFSHSSFGYLGRFSGGAQNSNYVFNNASSNLETFYTSIGMPTCWLTKLHAGLTRIFGTDFTVTKDPVIEMEGFNIGDGPFPNTYEKQTKRYGSVSITLEQKVVNPANGFSSLQQSNLATNDFLDIDNESASPRQRPMVGSTICVLEEGQRKERQTIYIVGREGPLKWVGDLAGTDTYELGDFDKNENADKTNEVAGAGLPQIIDPYHADTQKLTYTQIYQKIGKLLQAAKYQESAFLWYDEGIKTNTASGNYLEVCYPDDPLLRQVFSASKTQIDAASTFELAGITGFNTSTFNSLNRLYLKVHPLNRSDILTSGRFGYNRTRGITRSSITINGQQVTPFKSLPSNVYMETLNALYYAQENLSSINPMRYTITSASTVAHGQQVGDDNDGTGGVGDQTNNSIDTQWIIPAADISDRPLSFAKVDNRYYLGYLPSYEYVDFENNSSGDPLDRFYDAVALIYVGDVSNQARWGNGLGAGFGVKIDTGLQAKAYPAGSIPVTANSKSFGLNFTGVPTSGFTIEVVDEKYSPGVISDTIDRKVTFRATDKTASSFGSMNAFLTLQGQANIYDSLLPNINSSGDILWDYKEGTTEKSDDEIDLTNGSGSGAVYPLGWLLESFSEKYQQESKINNLVTQVGSNAFTAAVDLDPGGGVIPVIRFTAAADEGSSFNWSIPANSADTNWYTQYSNEYSVTNYLQKEFGANTQVYTKKTAKDLYLGFGNEVHGMNVARPAVYKYKALHNGNATTNSHEIVDQLVIDPPRGARFGLYNIGLQQQKYVYSLRSYGQLRDMFEQGVDTKFSNHSSNELVFGAPVIVSPINPVNPEVPKLMATTGRYNKTTNATITKPYIENGYENITQPNNLQSERLRVDVAGSISTKSITAPNNIAANIRTRS